MEENQKDMPAVQETPEAPQSEFVPSPKWKRVHRIAPEQIPSQSVCV